MAEEKKSLTAVLVLWKPKFFLRAVEEGIVG